MNNLAYQYHISGAVKSAVAYVLDNATSGSNGGSSGGVLNESTTAASSVPKVLYSEILYYEDYDSEGCTPQYNGNISRMVHKLAHINQFFSTERDVAYYYDELNRLTKVDDKDERDFYDEAFTYDAQGRITSQRRDGYINNATGGEYSYYAQSNRLEKVSAGMSNDVDFNRNMTSNENFIYDRDGNMIEDKSKEMTISYDHRGLPVEFKREVPSISGIAGEKDSVRLTLAYDGAGSRITKKRERKVSGGEWTTELTTHYTGIGSEIREDALNNATKVVVNLPQSLGRYDIEEASNQYAGIDPEQLAGYIPPAKFEWYLKNHLGSTMLVYGTQSYGDLMKPNFVGLKSAYDYRAFGEQVDLTMPTDKVTETFTGKEKDEETELSNHGARMLDPMLGVWIAVDPKRFFSSPYLYMGNGYNPLVNADTTGNNPVAEIGVRIAIATPSAIHNMYQTQNKLAENGASWFEMSYKGAATLFSTLLLSAVLPQANNPIVAGLLGAGTSATTNIINQKYIDGNESLDLNEVSNEARNGFMIGSFSAFGNAVASKVLLEPASTFVGDAIGTTTDVLLNQCEDK